MDKKTLGVAYGSRSCEHDVSIVSAVQMMRYADRAKYDVVPLYIARDGQWYTGAPLLEMSAYTPFRPEAAGIVRVTLDTAPGSGALIETVPARGLFGGEKRRVVARLDVVAPVMHGMHGEDGTLQGMLEMANLPYTSCGVASSAIGMDKILMKAAFKGCGIPAVEGVALTRDRYEANVEEAIADIEKALAYPVFVKPACLGSSIGVSRADDRAALKEALGTAFELDRRALIERAVKNPLELNCSVLGYGEEAEASEIEMPITGGDMLGFLEKYLTGSGTKGMASLKRVLPAPIEPALRDRIRALSVDIFRKLDCKGVVRIDFMYEPDTDGLFVTEINTIPGSLAYYLWEKSGLSYARLIDKMVEYALRAQQDKNRNGYAYSSDILRSVSLGGKTGAKGGKLGGKI